MDETRFDEMTRVFASGATRRVVLKGVLTALAATVGLHAESRAAAVKRKPGEVCRKSGECIEGAGCLADNTGRTRCTCLPGLTGCNGSCLQTDADVNNCGACGNVCPSGGCANGRCLKPDGEACAAAAECVTGYCADGVCCDGACAGQCATCDAAGQCLPIEGQPVNGRPACPSDGSICGGACDGSSPGCVFPAAGTECLPGMCAGPTLIAASVCDGAGACVSGQTTDCSPYFCGGDACLETCGNCVSGPCVDGVCCSEDDYCEGRCCSPGRASTEVCCPGTRRCCECFVRQEHGGGGRPPECCEKVCAGLTDSPDDDTCCRSDETCVEGSCVWNAQVCEDRACPNLCCNGKCCGPWETCGAAGCEPLPACTVDNEASVCSELERCAEIVSGTDSVCCPLNRVIESTDSAGAPTGTYECCPFGQEPPRSDSTTCCSGPDYCRTSRGGFGRLG